MDCTRCTDGIHQWHFSVPEHCAWSTQPLVGVSNSVAFDLAMTGPLLAAVTDKALGLRYRIAVAHLALLPTVATLGTVKAFAADTQGVASACTRGIHRLPIKGDSGLLDVGW